MYRFSLIPQDQGLLVQAAVKIKWRPSVSHEECLCVVLISIRQRLSVKYGRKSIKFYEIVGTEGEYKGVSEMAVMRQPSTKHEEEEEVVTKALRRWSLYGKACFWRSGLTKLEFSNLTQKCFRF